MVAVAQLVRASDCGSEGLRVRSPSATPIFFPEKFPEVNPLGNISYSRTPKTIFSRKEPLLLLLMLCSALHFAVLSLMLG